VLIGSVEATLLVLLVVVVFGPLVAERLRIPGIVGLIFGGTLFGPFVIAWLRADGLVTELGAIGILYLMFTAGITFDVRAFRTNRASAVTYGLTGFFIPFLLTFTVVVVAFDAGLVAGAMIGSMWASNTLVAYPQVQSAGLQGNRAVSAAVSAGVVADLFSLTILAAATATAVIEIEPVTGPFGRDITDLAGGAIEPSTPDPKLPLWLALPALAGFCLWVIPKVAEAFFVRMGRSRSQRFVFALIGMSAGATFALLGGIEGLIGAFLAGLGMNRLIHNQRPLMERIEFVGSSIFVPTFLVSIGLNIDPALLIDRDTLVLGLIFTGFVLVGKTTAAVITSLVFKFKPMETGLMSSLSFGQAASTLAVAQVGLDLGVFEQIVVNAAVIAIVITAIITSYGTRFFANRVTPPDDELPPIGTTVMLDARAHGSELHPLVDLAGRLAATDAGLVVPYLVSEPGDLEQSAARIDDATEALAAQGLDADGVIRIDDSFVDGTVHLIEERAASLAVVSWSGPRFATDLLLGNDVDDVGERCPIPTAAARMLRPWDRVVALAGDTGTSWRAEDAELAVEAARRCVDEDTPGVLIVEQRTQADALITEADTFTVAVRGEIDFDDLRPTDLVIGPAHFLQDLPPRAGWRASRILDDLNLVMIAGAHRLTTTKGAARRWTTGTTPRPLGDGER